MQPTRGEVWLFDLGMAAKTRPVLVVGVAYGDADRAIVTVVPHTTQLRGSPFEISVRAPFLQQGAFLVQGISTHPKAWAIRKIGALTRDQTHCGDQAMPGAQSAHHQVERFRQALLEGTEALAALEEDDCEGQHAGNKSHAG